MKDYRARFLGWKHGRELAGEKITLREIGERSGVHHTVIQRLASGAQKTFKAETLERIGVGIGEGADFFFRESPTGERRADRPHLWGDREGPAMDILEVVKTKWDCDTFTLLAVRSESEIEVLACQKGELVYHGPDRRESRKVRG